MTIPGIEFSPDVVARLVQIALIVAITLVLTRVAGGLVRRSMAATGALPATSILANITRAVVLIIGALMVLAVLDISITPVLTALGVGGLAVALALQDTLGNLFAGLQIIASRQVRPGDYVLLDTGQEGTVADVAWRTTTLLTQQDNLVIVPNGALAKTIITNYKLPAEPLSVPVDFQVGYDADLRRIEALVRDVAARVMAELQPDLADDEPVVRFRAFADSAITGVAVLRVREYAEQHPLRSAFITELHARFAAESIAFPVPTRSVRITRDS